MPNYRRRCAVSARFDAARGVRERLDDLPSTFPDDGSVAGRPRPRRLWPASRSDALARFDEDRRTAEQARTAAAQAGSELAHAAGLDSLPVALDGLGAVEAAATDMARDLQAWERLWAEWEGRQTGRRGAARQAERGRRRCRRRRQRPATQRTATRSGGALAALEDAIGATGRRGAGGHRRLRHWEAAQQALAVRLGAGPATPAVRREGRSRRRRRPPPTAVDGSGRCRVGAGERLRRAAVLPGVAVAAIGAEREWDGSGGVGAARALQARPQSGPRWCGAGPGGAQPLRDLEDGLAGGYDVVTSEDDGVKYFHVVDDTGRQPLPSGGGTGGRRGGGSERPATGRRTGGDRAVPPRRARRGVAGAAPRSARPGHAANRALAGVSAPRTGRAPTSTGRSTRRHAPAAPEATSSCSSMAPRAAEEDAQLRDALMELIRAQREKDPALGYLDHSPRGAGLPAVAPVRRASRRRRQARAPAGPLAPPRAFTRRAAGAVLPGPFRRRRCALRGARRGRAPAAASRRRLRQGGRTDPRPAAQAADRPRPRLPHHQRAHVGLLSARCRASRSTRRCASPRCRAWRWCTSAGTATSAT